MAATPKLARGLKWRAGTIHTDFVSSKGSRIRESLNTSDPALAEVMLGELKSALFRGTHVAPAQGGSAGGRLTVARAFDAASTGEWLADARPNTVKSAHHHFHRLTVSEGGKPPLLAPHMAVQDLTAATLVTLRRTMVEMGLSKGTVNLRMWVIRSILESAKASGAITAMPDIPKSFNTKSSARQRFTTPAEDVLVLEFLSTDDRYADLRDAWVIMLDTGLRVNEAARLTVKDIDLRNNTVRVLPEIDKSKDGRFVPMTTRVRAVVTRRASMGSSRLFPTESTNASYWVQKFGDLWRECRDELGLSDVVPHTCRHTAGTRLFEAGADLRTAMGFLGHKTPEMTLRYAKVVGERLRSAAQGIERITLQAQATAQELGTPIPSQVSHNPLETEAGCGPLGIQPSTDPSETLGPDQPAVPPNTEKP